MNTTAEKPANGTFLDATCRRKQMVLDTVSLDVETMVESQFSATVSEGDFRTGRSS
jgi:hypothetical protein